MGAYIKVTSLHPCLFCKLITMSALLGKAGKKLFEQHLESYAPADPLYETFVDDRGRQKRRKVRSSRHNVLLFQSGFDSGDCE